MVARGIGIGLLISAVVWAILAVILVVILSGCGSNLTAVPTYPASGNSPTGITPSQVVYEVTGPGPANVTWSDGQVRTTAKVALPWRGTATVDGYAVVRVDNGPARAAEYVCKISTESSAVLNVHTGLGHCSAQA